MFESVGVVPDEIFQENNVLSDDEENSYHEHESDSDSDEESDDSSDEDCQV